MLQSMLHSSAILHLLAVISSAIMISKLPALNNVLCNSIISHLSAVIVVWLAVLYHTLEDYITVLYNTYLPVYNMLYNTAI